MHFAQTKNGPSPAGWIVILCYKFITCNGALEEYMIQTSKACRHSVIHLCKREGNQFRGTAGPILTSQNFLVERERTKSTVLVWIRTRRSSPIYFPFSDAHCVEVIKIFEEAIYFRTSFRSASNSCHSSSTRRQAARRFRIWSTSSKTYICCWWYRGM